ncbi:MAG TPA: glutaredoxin domain-containing protein [Candidatus Sulfotelmatobacter sp.]|jgi:glutaredoxin
MTVRALFYFQPGCLSCELMRMVLEAKEIPFEEHDISKDLEARRIMTDEHDSTETPTLVVFSGEEVDVIVGFDPVRLDQFLDPAPSSDSVTES